MQQYDTQRLKPASVSIKSAAFFAASVAPCTAIPTWAALNAGASLTPSPVMPVTSPNLFLKVSTTSRLSLGNTAANL